MRLRHFIFIFILPFFFLTLVAKPVRAEMTLQEWWNAAGSDQPPNLGQLLNNDGFTPGILSGWAAQLTGGTTSSGEVIASGAIPATSKVIAMALANPPVKTSVYVADLLHNGFGLTPAAYAQGFGFSALRPILQIWKAFRNIAYFVFVIIFVVVGFMIMFRAKLNPQTVVNIQTALPKLVVTLLLITFSYAIAGFIVDLIYLLIFFVIGIFKTFNLIGVGPTDQPISDIFFGENIFGIGFKQLLGTGEAAGRAAKAVEQMVEALIGDPRIMETVGKFTTQPLAYVIIAVAIFIALLRTFFILLASYISILVSTIFAPLQILLNALPGSDTFGAWLKNLIANAAVFPTVAILILLGVVMIGPSQNNADFGVNPDVGFQSTEQPGFVAPFILKWGESSADAIQAIIGLGIIMLLPNAAKMIKEALEVKPSGIGAAAIGGVFAGPKVAMGAVSTPFELLYKAGYVSSSIAHAKGLIAKKQTEEPEKPQVQTS